MVLPAATFCCSPEKDFAELAPELERLMMQGVVEVVEMP
jgi:hypothetical protein